MHGTDFQVCKQINLLIDSYRFVTICAFSLWQHTHYTCWMIRKFDLFFVYSIYEQIIHTIHFSFRIECLNWIGYCVKLPTHGRFNEDDDAKISMQPLISEAHTVVEIIFDEYSSLIVQEHWSLHHQLMCTSHKQNDCDSNLEKL